MPYEDFPCAEAQVMELRQAFADYMATDRFEVGDLVTPKANGYLRAAGRPHLVVEIRPDVPFEFGHVTEPKQTGSAFYGCKRDMRVMSCNSDGDLVCHWVESWQFVPYTGALPGEG